MNVTRWTDDSVIASGATLRDAIIAGLQSRASFNCAMLCKADLSGLDLSSADFSEADLSFADMRGCMIQGANLTGAFIYKTQGMADSVMVAD